MASFFSAVNMLPDASFDVVTISFALRNVADQTKALREFRRVLRPGARLMVDFSTPSSKLLAMIHYLYFYVLIPVFGWAVAWHRDAHHYAADSMRGWASRDKLSEMILAAGFRDVRYVTLSGGLRPFISLASNKQIDLVDAFTGKVRLSLKGPAAGTSSSFKMAGSTSTVPIRGPSTENR